MYDTPQEKLQAAANLIMAAKWDMDKGAERHTVLINKLINTLEQIDLQYQDACAEMDEYDNLEEGTTYGVGFSSEFYIESDAWHQVSLVLRELLEKIECR